MEERLPLLLSLLANGRSQGHAQRWYPDIYGSEGWGFDSLPAREEEYRTLPPSLVPALVCTGRYAGAPQCLLARLVDVLLAPQQDRQCLLRHLVADHLDAEQLQRARPVRVG